jgi:murein L,D-transpeptidase YcbB/YkuD
MLTARSRTRRPIRRVRSLLLALCLGGAGLSAAPASAQDAFAVSAAVREADGPKEIRAFYATRGHQPLWIRDGSLDPAAEALLRLIESAELDGLDPDDYRPRTLAEALNRAGGGSPRSLARAEMLLSRTFVSLARDMRRTRDTGMLYADAELAPRPPSARDLLSRAADAGSLRAHVEGLGWMNPAYAKIRIAAAAHMEAGAGDRADLRLIRLNLDRARALPADARRFVLVDAAAARLWMYEDGEVAGTMRVVVGKPSEPTPMMAALIRYASVNPYWNLPPDLVPTRVAEGVLKQGPAYLKARRYEVLSDWSDQARPLEASEVDWQAVVDGRTELRVRQRPGPANPMGRVKFMFPNKLGVYLHDTNEKELLRAGERLFSAGCVRVEDAPRLARWLFGKPLPLAQAGAAERRVDLPEPVPVFLTYFTAGAEASGLVFREDVYGRDGIRLAASSMSRVATR